MPQVAVAAAAWIGTAITTVTTSATLGAMAANAVAALGFAQGIGAGLSAWATLASIGAAARGRPKVGGATGSPTDFRADPRAGIPYPIGETGVGGNIVYATTAETKNAHLLYLTVLSGGGPIEGVTQFRVGDEVVTFAGDTNAINARYHNKMWWKLQTGSNVPAPFMPPATTSLPEWTADHKLTGYTAYWWVLEYDQKAYPTGTPKPLTVGKWAKAYDPRLDSTYPGGSGSQRANDETTWAWSDNPFIHALTWCLGRYQNGKRILGVGAMLAMIDVAAFVEGANVCDANGWKIGGVVYSTDNKWEVLSAMLQAGGGWPTRLGAKISCGVNAPKVSIATLTGDDQAEGEVTVTAGRSWRDRFNAVIPAYRSTPHRYEVVPASKISVATYLAEDGEDLTCEPEFVLCPDVDQAAQLGRYVVANSREFGPVTIPCKPRWWGYKPNDCVTINEPEWGLVNQKVLIIDRARDPMTGIVTLSFMSETDAKHPACLGQTGTAPPTPGLIGYDPGVVEPPGSDAFTVAGATFSSPEGDIPALVVTGVSDNPFGIELLVRYRPQGATEWAYWSPVALPAFGDEIRVEITGVTPGTVYEAQTAYRSIRGVVSAWTAEGTATAGDFDVTKDFEIPSPNLWRKVDYVPSGSATSVAPAFGVANWGFRFTGAAAGAANVAGKIFATTANGGRYSLGFRAKLTAGTGTATVRAGFRDSLGNPIIDVPDAVFTIGTAEARFAWNNVRSADPDFVNAQFRIFVQAGDVAAGKAVDVTDVIVVFGNKAPSGFAPCPDDPEGLRLFGYTGALDATRNTVTRSPTAPALPINGDIWVDTSVTPPREYHRVSGSWQLAATVGAVYGVDIYEASGGSIAALNAFKTALGIAAAIAGQAPAATDPTIETGATKNRLFYQSAAPASPNNGDLWCDTSTTPNVWKIRIAGAWQNAASFGGVFGSTLYEAAGILATNAAYKTALGTAAGFTGQGPWATYSTLTPTVVAGRLVYVDNNGLIYDFRAFPINGLVGWAGGREIWPLSSTSSSISVLAYTEFRPNGSISVPAGTIVGLAADTYYDVFYTVTTGTLIAVSTSVSHLYKADPINYLFVGIQKTAQSGGGYSPPPPAPPGAGGGGSGNGTEWV